MHGQGNYPPPFGLGSNTRIPPFQQRPIAPPSPPLQQGLSASQPSTIQQGPPSIPHHVSYSVPFTYHHAPPPLVQQGPLPPVNGGPSYLPPPPPLPHHVRGSTFVAHPYPTVQGNSQWIQNKQHGPTPVPLPLGPPPTGPSHPEMFRPLIPPRVLPTLNSQEQIPYREPSLLPQTGNVQVTQQIPSLPLPPPASSLFTPAPPFGSFVYTTYQDFNAPAIGPTPTLPPPPPPPPPPSSPPPLPPSPPPPTSPLPSFGTLSSAPPLANSDLSANSELGPTSNLTGFKVAASDSVDKVVVTSQISEDALASDEDKNLEGSTCYEAASPVKVDLPNVEGTTLDFPPPPPKPAEDKVVRRIELLCRFIAKNGPGFEEMIRRKETRNPEFEFLFGGEPESEAAVAHEYFEWMKNTGSLPCKLQEHSNLALRPSDIYASTQTDRLRDAGVSHSHSDSDMDMEDDITQPDEEQRVSNSFESLNSEAILIPKEPVIRGQLSTPLNAIEHSLAKDAIFGSPGLAKREKGSESFLDDDHLTYGTSLAKVDSSFTNSIGALGGPPKSNSEKHSIPPLEDSSQYMASAASAGTVSEKFPGGLIKGASPFRLLQDYASDDSSEEDDKPCLEDFNPVTASPSTTTGGTSLHRDSDYTLQIDPESKSLPSSDIEFGTFSESVVAFSSSMPSNAVENITSIASVEIEELVGINNENQVSSDTAILPKALHQKDALDGLHKAAPESDKSQSQKEDLKRICTFPKVDEFGRLVREDASDSDSDDSHYTRRRGKRRRSWSRSRSPHDRRRRSPRRRKVRRSQSPSWSPKKRRSRSRSPSHRHGVESSSDMMRRDRGQLPECFDFLRGRCYRGAFCRYMHHDSGMSDGVRLYRSKQQHVEVPPVSMTSNSPEETKKAPLIRSVHDQDMDREKVLASVWDPVQTIISDQENKSLVIGVKKCEGSREVNEIMQETQYIKEEMLEPKTVPDNENCLEMADTFQPVDGSPSRLFADAGVPKSRGDASHCISSPLETWEIQNADRQRQDADGCSTSGSSLVQSSTSFQNQLQVTAPHLIMISPIQPSTGTSSISQPFSSDGFSSQTLLSKELIPPSTPPVIFSQNSSTPPPPQIPGEIMQPTSNFPSLYPPMGNSLPNQAPLQFQHSHFDGPPNSSWSLPPPPPLPPRPSFINNSTVTAATAMQGAPWSQFPQNILPPRSDLSIQTFFSPFPPQLSSQSQLGEFQPYSNSLMKGHELPHPSSHVEDFRPKPPLMSNSISQPFGGTGFSQFQIQGLNPSFAQGSTSLQPVPSVGDPSARRIQSFPGDEYPTSFQNHHYSHQQLPLYGQQRHESDGPSVTMGEYGNVNSTKPRYTSDLADKKPLSHMSDIGGSRISSHYNPYASTFEQPLTSKISEFNSNVIKEQKDISYSNLFDASGQYDPLFDSIEPSSNSFKRFNHGLSRELMLRLSGSGKPLDVEENYKQKEVEAVAETASIKSENDEYGETADAEVGDVDNASATNSFDEANAAAGEIEIDQIKMSGKSKSKDSRSLKLFKGAIAKFVKEMLKPNWRQGNMSKEAYKTIVKKTVDKVSAAMKGHHIPKSQAKINQYIDSSRRKLTKLVQGYEHKYAKG